LTEESLRPTMGMPSWPPRLLLAVDSLEVGGAERHVVDLALALHRKGYGVEVACSVAGGLSESLEAAGVPVWPLTGRLVKRRVSPAYARGIRRLLRGGGFDLVHAHIFASAAAAAIATLGKGLPLVITEHTEASWQTWRTRWISRWAHRRARHTIAVSTPIERRLIERDGVPSDLVTLIPNAVIPAPDETPDSASTLPDGWPEGPLIGVVARLQPEKGVANFLQAATRVSRIFPEAGFLVVGDGPLREELLSLVERLGISKRVRFLGYRTDSRALMGLMDVLVVPSLTEGSPLIVLEAMAAGIPVVASAVGGIPDQLRHGEEGILVPPDDPDALGEALGALLRDPAYARRLGETGRLRTENEFSHETLVRRIEVVYRAALDGDTARSAAREPEIPSPR
jgi:glycosyltransferase involved in cell wall biosynthesis